MRRSLTIGLMWHSFSSNNLGVGALSVSQLNLLESICKDLNIDSRYIVFGTLGQHNYLEGPSEDRIDFIHLTPKRVALSLANTGTAISQALEKCDIVLDIGEGDSFTDIYGLKRFFMLTATKYLVFKAQRSLVICPQTIGPFNHPIARAIANRIIKRATQVFARDHLSYSYLSSQGLVGKAAEVIDVAFALPFHKKEMQPSDKVKLGVNISGLLYQGGYNSRNQFDLKFTYREMIHKLIEHLSDDANHEVHLISHVVAKTAGFEDDYQAAFEIKKVFPNCVLAPKFGSPSEAKSYIAEMDFFTGARMHATIAAFSAGIPVVPLAYSKKFQGLFSSLNYEAVADGKSHSQSQVISLILDGFANRNNLSKGVVEGNAIAQSKLDLYRSQLKEILREA